MKKYINKKVNPGSMVGRYIKYNKTKYRVEQMIGYGEHRFVFELTNEKDRCSFFNLLVFRKNDSYEFAKAEMMRSAAEHKRMKMHYLKKLNCALRERIDIYNMLDEKQLSHIDGSIYLCLKTKAYNKAISILNDCNKNSYVLILLSYCYKMLGDKRHLVYLKKAKKREKNFDFDALLRAWQEKTLDS